MKPGTRVRMTEEFKRQMRGACGPNWHVGLPDGVYDPEMPDGGCLKCSTSHVDEFAGCVGVVEGPMFPDDPSAPEVDVRWQPSGLRYGYHPSSLEIVQ